MDTLHLGAADVCRTLAPGSSCSNAIVLSGRGHSVFEETPEEANRIMQEWLGRHS